jgi:hypothetical protein
MVYNIDSNNVESVSKVGNAKVSDLDKVKNMDVVLFVEDSDDEDKVRSDVDVDKYLTDKAICKCSIL